MWFGLQVENSKYLRECYTNTWGEANCEKVTAVSCGKCAKYCHYLRPTHHLVIAIITVFFTAIQVQTFIDKISPLADKSMPLTAGMNAV
jgi:hypothetical protein